MTPPPSFRSYISRMRNQAAIADLIVLGNQGADLDSVASSLVLAWHLACQHPHKKVVARIAVPRSALRLRPEVTCALALAGIRTRDLLFTDDPLPVPVAGTVAELVMVDHNSPETAGPFAQLHVTAIIDHHHDEGLFPEAVPRIVDTVGSTATLVAERILAENKTMAEEAACLLLSAILLDTVNLCPLAQRTTARDRKISARLMALCPLARQRLYDDLEQSRLDLGGLSSDDLLIRDYKEWSSPSGRYGISSVFIPVRLWQQRQPDITTAMTRLVNGHNLALLLVMLAGYDPDFQRHLLIFSPDSNVIADLESFFCEHNLQLSALPANNADTTKGLFRLYRQGNVTISRKKIQPLIHGWLADRLLSVADQTPQNAK